MVGKPASKRREPNEDRCPGLLTRFHPRVWHYRHTSNLDKPRRALASSLPPSRSSQHGCAAPSAVVSCTRSSRGDWKICWESRWGAGADTACGSTAAQEPFPIALVNGCSQFAFITRGWFDKVIKASARAVKHLTFKTNRWAHKNGYATVHVAKSSSVCADKGLIAHCKASRKVCG